MTATATAHTTRTGRAGERVESGRYRTPYCERLAIGQRVLGIVRLSDVPASGRGRRYLVERELIGAAPVTSISSAQHGAAAVPE